MDTVDSSLAFSQQVALLEKKRAVLLGLLRLTETLQQLRVALSSVLQLGGAAGAAPSDSDLRAFEVIRQRVADLSSAELRQAIEQLDGKVRDSLAQISTMALQLVDDARASLSDLELIHPRVNGFNRFARTNIAMRVLLEQRGESLPALQFELPREAIAQRLARVEEKEQGICRALVAHIQDMRGDLALMLGNPHCAESQTQFYQVLDQALAANLAHIEAGLSLSELPMPIESIEVEGGGSVEHADSPVAEPVGTAEAETAASASPLPDVAPDPLPAPGLLGRLRRWLSSPVEVRWRDLQPPADPAKRRDGE